MQNASKRMSSLQRGWGGSKKQQCTLREICEPRNIQVGLVFFSRELHSRLLLLLATFVKR